jgi:hypothetical protein
MFTRLCLGCVLGLTLIAFSPAGANAEGLFNRDGGLFGGDKARGPEATWKDEIPQERGAKDADNRAERCTERNH